MSQKPGTVPGRWDCPKDPESQHHGVYFSISAQKLGTVPGIWDCPIEAQDSPGTLGLSQRPRVPTPWSIFLNFRDPKAWDSPWPLGLSQKPGTVPGRWDCPKDQEFQHHGVYFSISETQKAWDSPGTLELSQNPEFQHNGVYFSKSKTQKSGTVPGLWDCLRSTGTSWDSPNFKVFDTCC